MADSTDFLSRFTEKLKSKIGEDPVRLLDGLEFHAEISPDEVISHLKELKVLLDKILSIFYRPHIKVESKEVILRSELSGKLSHDSFSLTMKDSRLWKEKNHEMVPEYVYSRETIDSIKTYENGFIAELVDIIEEEIEERRSDERPLVESIEEHYQRKEVSFGEYSLIHDLRSLNYPYPSFFLKGKDKKDEIILLTRKLLRRVRNLKSMHFYKVNHGTLKGRNVIPTNILIHDPLYSYCYRYYVNHYKNLSSSSRRREILYMNYFIVSLYKALKALSPANVSTTFFFTREDLLSFSSFTFHHDPFTFSFSLDQENISLLMDVSLKDDKNETYHSKYCLILRERYVKENEKNISLLSSRMSSIYDEVLLVTSRNVIRNYHDVMTFSYHDENNMDLIYDLLSMAGNLFEANGDIYSSICPVCGKEKLIYDGKRFLCEDCKSTYALIRIQNIPLLWLMSYRKENPYD